MLKIVPKKNRTEPKFIDMGPMRPPEPAAAPWAVKARINRLLKQKQRLLEDAIPESRDYLVPFIERVLVSLKKFPTENQVSSVANASNLIDIWLAGDLARKLED
jgi:hypothetical protein